MKASQRMCLSDVSSYQQKSIVSIIMGIVFHSDSRSKLFVDCFADYNPERLKYNVVSNWSISDPLATEAALVNGYRVRIREYPGFSNRRVNVTNVRQALFIIICRLLFVLYLPYRTVAIFLEIFLF